MHIISRKCLKDFWKKHNQAERALSAWYSEAKKANWTSFDDIKKMYKNADLVAENRVIFNIGGNKYRLIVKFDFQKKVAFIKFVGTHSEYNKIQAGEVECRQ